MDSGECSELFEPGFLYGWGVFETVRVYNGAVVRLDAHIDRMKKGIDLLGLDYPQNIDFKAVSEKIIKENALKEAYIRINVYKKTQGYDAGLITSLEVN